MYIWWSGHVSPFLRPIDVWAEINNPFSFLFFRCENHSILGPLSFGVPRSPIFSADSFGLFFAVAFVWAPVADRRARSDDFAKYAVGDDSVFDGGGGVGKEKEENSCNRGGLIWSILDSLFRAGVLQIARYDAHIFFQKESIVSSRCFETYFRCLCAFEICVSNRARDGKGSQSFCTRLICFAI